MIFCVIIPTTGFRFVKKGFPIWMEGVKHQASHDVKHKEENHEKEEEQATHGDNKFFCVCNT